MSAVLAMCFYSLSMSISPGPVNMIALTTGLNRGFRRAMPFVSGATIGFSLLLLMIGLGMGQVAANVPLFLELLSYSGAAFIAYIGYKIAISSATIQMGEQTSSSFFHGVLLQWLNPKAWIACFSGVTAFNLVEIEPLLVFVTLYFLICYISIACWALAGDKISSLLAKPENLRLFNRLMGGALVLVAVYLILAQINILSGH